MRNMERSDKLTINAQARNLKAQPKWATVTSHIELEKKLIKEALATGYVFWVTKKRGHDPVLSERKPGCCAVRKD